MRRIQGKIHIPTGLQSDPHIIVPDEVVRFIAKKFALTQNKIGIDPMCGAGTIPRVIHELGGICDGIEIDRHHYEIAKNEAVNSTITLGDFTELRTKVYDYVYTSLPFNWFNKNYPSSIYAEVIKQMLKPGGILIIDGTDIARRNEEQWDLANTQVNYFTNNGFKLGNKLSFKTQKLHGQDDVFVELQFSLV